MSRKCEANCLNEQIYKGLKSLSIILSQDFHEKFMLQIEEISRENVQKESLYFQTTGQTILCKCM